MRCTKCHYLSFDPEPRCRNCGHDLSLEEGSAFNLANSHDHREAAAAAGESGRTATAVLTPPKPKTSSRIPTADLPLFVQSMQGVSDRLAGEADPVEIAPEDIEPLVKVPARPRTPMSVRRATPDPARLRAKYGMSPSAEPDLWSNLPPEPIDRVALHDTPEDLQDLPLTGEAQQWTNGPMGQWTNDADQPPATGTSPQTTSGPGDQWTNGPVDQWADDAAEQWTNGARHAWPSEPTPMRLPAGWQEPVGVGARLGAAVIDALLLGGISAGVIYFTLQVTGLSLSQISLLPVLPMSGLVLLVAVGYLLMFTVASGQTVGKMAMNLRVVGTSAEAVINDRITVSQALVRTLAAVPSVLVFGLGFIPAFLGAGLALHDRVAHTRVVRQ